MKVSLIVNMLCFFYVTLLSRATTLGCVEANDFELFKMDMMKRMKLLSEKVEEMETMNAEQTLRLLEQDLKIAELEKELKQATQLREDDFEMAEQVMEPKLLSSNFAFKTNDIERENDTVSRPEKETKISSTKTDLNPVRRKTAARRQYDGKPSFFAELSTTLKSLSPDHDIHFDHVITNNGGGYKGFTGTFTVPEAGVYFFTWSITGYNEKGNVVIPVQLVVNGEIRGRCDVFTSVHFDTVTVSGFVVLNVNAGDVALIRTHQTIQPAGQLISNEWHRSTFGGWKIY